MGKRLFDIVFSLVMLIVLTPLLLAISIAVMLDSKGGIFFGQIRTGKDYKPFKLWKFRTMHPNAESQGQLTVGARDNRITKVGYILRKYKIDELPQLWNVLTGDMSTVGPRPEVPRYTSMYNDQQKKVLSIKPGITDYASLLYYEESALLAQAKNPEEVYINEIMPAKLNLNLHYVQNNSFAGDLKIILATIKRMFG
jgi:lipopolysaccharide/colanic/teichoic acid biosynthesis glycosyltransferase